MRDLVYKTWSGKIYKTMAEAMASGEKYRVILYDAPEKPKKLTPIKTAMLKQFGYVSPKLKDKVAM